MNRGYALDGDAPVDGENAVGQFVDQHGHEEEDRRGGAHQPLLRRRPEGVPVAHPVGKQEGHQGQNDEPAIADGQRDAEDPAQADVSAHHFLPLGEGFRGLQIGGFGDCLANRTDGLSDDGVVVNKDAADQLVHQLGGGIGAGVGAFVGA